MMSKRDKQIIGICLLGGVALAALSHPGGVSAALDRLGALLFPLATGCILALFVNVPMTGIERLLSGLCRRPGKGRRWIRPTALVLTWGLLVCALGLIFTLVIPELLASLPELQNAVTVKLPQLLDGLGRYGLDFSGAADTLREFDFNVISGYVQEHMDSMMGAFKNTAVTIFDVTVAIALSCYILSGKEKLGGQLRRLLYTWLPKGRAEKLCKLASLSESAFSRYLAGQSCEAVIIGSLILLAYTALCLPHGVLVGVLTGVCSFIPYLGALAACGFGCLLTLVESPVKALIALIVYLVVQLLDGQVIYPRVMGRSVGLPPIWVLLAVILGGELFGVVGMVLVIPAASVLYTLLREHTREKLGEQAADRQAAGKGDP